MPIVTIKKYLQMLPDGSWRQNHLQREPPAWHNFSQDPKAPERDLYLLIQILDEFGVISFTMYVPPVKAHTLLISLVTLGYVSASLYSRFLNEGESFSGSETRIGGNIEYPYLEPWIMGWWICFPVVHSVQGTNWLQERKANLAHRCECWIGMVLYIF